MALEQSATSLAPGFRFHPTDEELVRYYLKRKVMNKPFRFDPISVIDVYKSEPWDLPSKSRLKSRDLEWYFFSMLDKKYSNGSKTNRATEKGYWKTTGKDRAIKWNSRAVAMKKTLVYHQGRAPKGERSNWVMHEYRLVDEELERAGIAQDSFVLCRIFQKSGTGPKNGEQYGAPFVEEEWDDVDNEPLEVLCSDALLALPDDNYVESGSRFRNAEPDSVDNEVSPFKGTFPDKIYYENAPEESVEVDVKPEMTANEEEKILTDFPFESYFDGETFESNENNLLTSFSPDTTDFDAVAEYLNFFDAEESNMEFGGSENIPTVKEEPEEASCSRKSPPVEYEPDTKPSFSKRKSHLLGAGHVSEYPLKETGLLLQPGQSSTSIHVTAGLIRVKTVRCVWPDGKNVEVEVIGGKLGFSGWAMLILVWVVMLSISYRVVLDVTAKM